jgi:hydrogenase/urease accessory protein HupE
MKYVLSFGRFWWDFVVGDDWRVAAIVVVAIGVTAAVAASGIAAWWVMPLTVVLALAVSLRRASAG